MVGCLAIVSVRQCSLELNGHLTGKLLLWFLEPPPAAFRSISNHTESDMLRKESNARLPPEWFQQPICLVLWRYNPLVRGVR